MYVSGRLQTRSWEDQSGQKKYKTEIVTEDLIILTPKNSSENDTSSYHVEENTQDMPVKTTVPQPEERVSIEDVPF